MLILPFNLGNCFFIGKLHLVGIEPTTPSFTLLLQGEDVPFELELIGGWVTCCLYMISTSSRSANSVCEIDSFIFSFSFKFRL